MATGPEGRTSMLMVFGGLPGVGKTTLAKGLAAKLVAAHLRIDSIERALADSSLQIAAAEDAGYCVGYALAEDNLRLGLMVVADSVNPVEQTRRAWRDVAQRAGVTIMEIEVICSDPVEHRHRVEARSAASTDQRPPSWQDVMGRHYDPWVGEHTVIDTAGQPPKSCLRDLLERLRQAGVQSR